MKDRIIKCFLVGWMGIFNACNYLDVVPDNIATIDNAFTNRTMAEKFLFTCYSYMPNHADYSSQAFLIGDEFWLNEEYPSDLFTNIARGNQGVVNPYMNYWDGLNGGIKLFVAIRDCNTFLERLNGDIPGLYEWEKKRWVAEVKFLKAYYHYWLLRMYGPIPLIRENLPVSADVEEVLVQREPVDACFDYIVSLLDEAAPDLPLVLDNIATEMGRITQPIALAVIAKVLVESASPLFNGNTDYANFKRKKDGVQYFNQMYDHSKWEKAVAACRNAIDTCHTAGFALYHYELGFGEKLVPETVIEMSIRNSVTENNYTINQEVVWKNTNSLSSSGGVNNIEGLATPRVDPDKYGNQGTRSVLAPPLKIAEMFYTANGVPIDEDREWESSRKYAERYQIKNATEKDKYQVKEGKQTAILNFDREIRFYANLSFDGGLWFGLGRFDSDNQWVMNAKLGEHAGKIIRALYSCTGYFCKKLVGYRNVIVGETGTGYTVVGYAWPVIRLADLYLLYSEAINEAYGPEGAEDHDPYFWIDEVRKRAGLEGVVNSWDKYAKEALRTKPTTREGFRDIIQRERLIELANEGHRYWEIRRWKRAKELWHNQPIQGWDIEQNEPNAYYRVRTLFTPQFTTKNYFWPIREHNLTVNPYLDQNTGW